MGIIKLQNIRTFSYHGCLVEEERIGSDYRVDLEVKTDLRKSSQSDELSDTVSRIKLEVSKLNPPIGGDVEAVTIEMEEFRN